MAFINVEDLVGSVEVIIWPNDYERNAREIVEDSKVFIQGRVNAEEEKDAKLICEKIIPFDSIPKKVWIRFNTREDYQAQEDVLFQTIADSDGHDLISIYIDKTREIKTLPKSKSVKADMELLEKLRELFGKESVKIV